MSWYKTCGLSGLPIFDDEPVTIVVIEQNVSSMHERSTGSDFWKPVFLPIYAKYDGYGGGKECAGMGSRLILDWLRPHIVEKEAGKEYGQIAVKKDSLTMESFFEAVHKGALEVNLPGGYDTAKVEFVMIKQSVMDTLLGEFKFSDYVGDGLGNGGEDNDYHQYSFNDVLKDVSAWVEKASDQDVLFTDHFGFLFDKREGEENLAQLFLRSSFNEARSAGHSNIHILDHVKTNPEYVKQFLGESLQIRFVQRFMDAIRKSWAPGAFEGMDDREYDAYTFLAGTVIKEAEFDFLDKQEMGYDHESMYSPG